MATTTSSEPSFRSQHVRPARQTVTWNGRDDRALRSGRDLQAARPPRRRAPDDPAAEPIAVDTKAPHISLTRTSLQGRLARRRLRIDDYLTVFFQTSEPARAVLYANGRKVVKVKSFSAHSLKWGSGTGCRRSRASTGSAAAIDAAGNPGREPDLQSQIRYIELGRNVIRRGPGARSRAVLHGRPLLLLADRAAARARP
jgi:hypothetical protein